jgi:hypothetical protein
MTVDGRRVTLRSRHEMTRADATVLVGLAAAIGLGLGLGLWQGDMWWYLAIGAGIAFAYGLWTATYSMRARIVFGDGTVSVNGLGLDAARHGPFYFAAEGAGDESDDPPGGNALWLASQDGDPVFVATMSLDTDTDAIARRLNDLLETSRAG